MILVSGASGLIGSALTRALRSRNVQVKRLVRRRASQPDEVSWYPDRQEIDSHAMDGVTAVVNLAGENLSQRWTSSARQRIRDSRIQATTLLAQTVAGSNPRPRVFLSASAMGIYGTHRDDPVDEGATLGDDFLATVCKEWEAATGPAADAGVRVAFSRTGLVMARDGGVLAKVLLPFRLGLGGTLGGGRQWMSWIALTDVVRALGFIVDNESVRGPVNVVGPNPVTNAEFTDTLGRVLGRPTVTVVPAFALKLALGQMAEDTALASQRVVPGRLNDAGFQFEFPSLDGALRHELAS
ncbi:MAG TPA: TIGR01777 family oxidoreductase [Gemmatimonadaceae bacterium]